MKVVVTIEARMSATRLPGKVLFPIVGLPALGFLISRLRMATMIDEIVVATTENPVDAPIEAWARTLGVSVFRGSEVDVMGRVLGAARSVQAEVIVELTADNPLIDPKIIDRAVNCFLSGDIDYLSNVTHRTYPLGMDTQVFSTRVLEDAYSRTQDPEHLEHVSLFIYRNPSIYRLGIFEASDECQRPDLRLTMDTIEDYQVIVSCAEACTQINPNFGLEELIRFCDRSPEITALNNEVIHKWV